MSVDYSAGLYYGVDVSNEWVQSLPENAFITLREDYDFLHRMSDYEDSPVWIYGIRIAGCGDSYAIPIDRMDILAVGSQEDLISLKNIAKEFHIEGKWQYFLGCEVH